MKKLILFFLCCLLLSACGKTEPAPSPSAAAQHSFTLYYGDDNAEKLLSEEVTVSALNAETVTAELIRIGVLREGVAVNNMTLKADVLELDFNQAFAELLCSMGSSGEYIIVGAVVNSFLDAFGAARLMFTVDGEILETGHVIYDFPMEAFQ